MDDGYFFNDDVYLITLLAPILEIVQKSPCGDVGRVEKEEREND